MSYQLRRLNVVKTVESEGKRDALITKGFVEVKEKQSKAKEPEGGKGEGGDKGAK